MTFEEYIVGTICVCILALIWFFRKPCYRLLIPSTISYTVWGITSVLIYLSTLGGMATGKYTVNDYNLMIPFLFGMMISGFFGFNLAHIFTKNPDVEVNTFRTSYINWLLSRYKWIIYVCFISGIINLVFLIITIGYDNLNDYRIAALLVKRNALLQLIRTIGGHAGLLGFFYFAIYGYKQAYCGVDAKQLALYIIMLGMNNIAIAGRAWIVMAMVPYVIGYLYGYKSNFDRASELFKSNAQKIIILGCVLGFLFMFVGVFRSSDKMTDEDRLIDKWLYITDGSRVSNIVMKMYPEGTFPLEYGQSEFLNNWFPSPMKTKYYSDISDNIGLTVTVTSTIPTLYFDFGFNGGIIMWGVYCFLFELICLNMLQKNSILTFFLAVQLTRMMYQAPIGEIFGMAISTFEWLLILYIFRKRLFTMPVSLEHE